jgi:hypothetical protein
MKKAEKQTRKKKNFLLFFLARSLAHQHNKTFTFQPRTHVRIAPHLNSTFLHFPLLYFFLSTLLHLVLAVGGEGWCGGDKPEENDGKWILFRKKGKRYARQQFRLHFQLTKSYRV